ncbi:Cell division control protein 11 [Nosema granulosis]|uniref:Cell division control protein 11 n=1 Tax=Nosema granulosis TaxID=83296 RepID=A0A9P6GXE2_9MICR|nr:Cell division control protein 11 [Nosema granulosis]
MMLKRKNRRFSIMAAGCKGSGKSSFFNTLFNNDIVPHESSRDINLYMLNVDCEGVTQKVSLIDTPGFGDEISDTDIQENIVSFIKMQFDAFIEEESKIRRDPTFEDTRVHCLLYFISASGNGLKQTDLSFLSKVKDLVNIVPVLSKSDGILACEREELKIKIREQLLSANINVFDFENQEYCENVNEEQGINEYVPFHVISACEDNVTSRSRKFKWGTIDVDNTEHCDFSILKEILLGSHLTVFIDYTASELYEKYRSSVLEMKN